MNLDPQFSYKTNSKLTKDLNISSGAVKVLKKKKEKTVGERLYNIGLAMIFLYT
jgi:hypothetical protein